MQCWVINYMDVPRDLGQSKAGTQEFKADTFFYSDKRSDHTTMVHWNIATGNPLIDQGNV